MSLVHCAECNNLVSNKSTFCPSYGYSPIGNCESCKHFVLLDFSETLGRCTLLEKEFVRKDKSICPAVKKKFIF